MTPRRVAMVSLMCFFLLILAGGAQASVSGPCNGSATVAGVAYGPANDTPANPIVIPADRSGLTVQWEATTGVPITDHTGSVGIVFGPGVMNIANWGGNNADLETSAAGSYSWDLLPGTLKNLTGLYEVEAEHAGTGGACEGRVMVKLEGNPATTPVGAAAIAGTLLSGIGLFLAGRGKPA